MSVLGHHSVGELRDWLVDIDYQAAQIGAAYEAFAPAWQAQDTAAQHEWAGEWGKWLKYSNITHRLFSGSELGAGAG